IKEWSTFLMFASDETLEHKKQIKGNSCKNRFCPVCAWRKARKDALKLSILMKYIQAEHQKEFIFLTLTAPNVSAEDLDNEIKKYNQSFKKLMERKEIKSITKGYVRKLEVTYNQERNDYHPHFHVMIAVNKSYFNKPTQYIKRDKWLELWQQVTDNPSITQVDVRKIKQNNHKEISEVAKYSAKDSDYLINENVFKTFYKALKGKRLIVYSGLFKTASKLFEEGEIDKYKEVDTTEYIYALMYSWGKGKYVEDEKRKLTEDEYRKLNKKLINELEIE
ncbi:protein rep, partial [Klebsiella pneumoniae]|uniref:protein rep n=1 Tax=Klebsiella pneumoniae TaxID=573 RepID=UPI001D0D9AE0